MMAEAQSTRKGKDIVCSAWQHAAGFVPGMGFAACSEQKVNSTDAYTAEVRSYDQSMLGLFGMYTPISSEVGVNRRLTAKPKIADTRGYIKKGFDVKTATQEELFSVGELVNNFAVTNSDSMRALMTTVQSGHIIPTYKQHSYIVSVGGDKILPHVIGNDFAFKADEDGEVTKIDKAHKLVFLKYKSGLTTAIDISDKPVKNTNSGFFTNNRLDMVDRFGKVGSKFKKGDIIATNRSFFKEFKEGQNSFGFAAGRISKVAVMSLDVTVEDSSAITTTLRDEMASDILSEREVFLKKNSRIVRLAKIGDEVDVNTPLVIFEEVGDNEQATIKALEKLGHKEGDAVTELARSVAKSKLAGVIDYIEILYNADITEMHETLQKVVKGYIKENSEKVAALSGIRKDELIKTPSTVRIDRDKIHGQEIDGVVIIFYIRHKELCETGGKISLFGACKSVVGEVIPEGLEPYSEYRKNEPVECFLSPMSFIGRMTPDIFLQGYANKVMIELKKQCLEDLGFASVSDLDQPK